MYNYYGFTDQLFQVVYVLNTTVQDERIIGGVKYRMIRISKKRMFGTDEIEIKGVKINLSNREKTIVDLIYYPNPVGGLKEAYKILTGQIKDNKVKIKRLIEYAGKFFLVSPKKRIGYILEINGINAAKLSKYVNNKSLSNLYEGKLRKGKIDKKRGLILNDTR